MFLDSCHSGTGLGENSLGRSPELGPEHPILARYLPPPVDIECRVEGEEEELRPTKGFRSKTRSTVNHVLWAGCKDNQTSADAYINGAYNGAFTYHFCKHMGDTGGRINRKDLLSRIRQSLRHNNYAQVPKLEAEATKQKGGNLTINEKI